MVCSACLFLEHSISRIPLQVQTCVWNPQYGSCEQFAKLYAAFEVWHVLIYFLYFGRRQLCVRTWMQCVLHCKPLSVWRTFPHRWLNDTTNPRLKWGKCVRQLIACVFYLCVKVTHILFYVLNLESCLSLCAVVMHVCNISHTVT